ncbi:GspE/PulE/PilB domain-containing protein [Geotalea uraniireducens]|uniref:General secretory system II, protein E domain protein n=1 Tax=Geotalea uraniireducens (strain Rf4) TaxID=351605 RepID=A5GB09_GEOUR|nr:general secretion pathway protein GspE [Geotalea uraniireducens]ABQ25243.1 General secretory system II, protein E domain protein [Geotalea uraniireducens Rf4]
MTIKLGEMLVKAGKITPAELDETLKSQVIFGGRIGTNLIEMGYIEEKDLAHFLSMKLGVPYASSDQLMALSPQVLKLIPEEVVKKYKVIPLGLDKKKLVVAMADPSDFASIEEISFITGFIVMPLVSPELRLILALEKHYDIKRETRYISVTSGGRRRAREAESAEPPPREPKKAKAAFTPSVEEEVIELPLLSELDDYGLEPAEELMQGNLPNAAAREETIRQYTIDTFSMQLAEAKDRDAIANLIVNYTGQEFDRVALFLVRRNVAGGWTALSRKKVVAGFEELQIPLDAPSVLKMVADGKSFYLGPLTDTPANTKILTALEGGKPACALLIPLLMMGRVVAIFYVDGGAGDLGDRVVDMQKLIGKAAMAFEILILKNKILMT